MLKIQYKKQVPHELTDQKSTKTRLTVNINNTIFFFIYN